MHLSYLLEWVKLFMRTAVLTGKEKQEMKQDFQVTQKVQSKRRGTWLLASPSLAPISLCSFKRAFVGT